MNNVSRKFLTCIGEKGGTGKSTCAAAVTDHLRASGIQIAAFDADGTVGSLVRALGIRDQSGKVEERQDPLCGVSTYNLRSDQQRHILLDSMGQQYDVLCHDMPGGALMDISRIADAGQGDGLEAFLTALKSNNYRLVLLHLVSPDPASVVSIERYMQLVGSEADHIAVINRTFGRPDSDFPWWFGFDSGGRRMGGKTRAKLLALGGAEISLPHMPAGTVQKIAAHQLRFSEAGKSKLLTITEQSHVTTFTREFGSQLAKIMHFLLPEKG